MNISVTHSALILFHLTNLIKTMRYFKPNIQVLFPLKVNSPQPKTILIFWVLQFHAKSSKDL